jgi:hypothetical protein
MFTKLTELVFSLEVVDSVGFAGCAFTNKIENNTNNIANRFFITASLLGKRK